MSAPAESRDDVFSERVRSQTGGTIVSVAAAAVIDWTGLSTNPLVHAMAVRTKGMERPVDARRLRQRDALVTVEAVLTAGAVDEVVVAPDARKPEVIGVKETSMINWRSCQRRQTRRRQSADGGLDHRSDKQPEGDRQSNDMPFTQETFEEDNGQTRQDHEGSNQVHASDQGYMRTAGR